MGAWRELLEDAGFFETSWRRRFLHLPRAASLEGWPGLEEVRGLVDGEAVEEDEAVRFASFPPSGVPVVRTWLRAEARVRPAGEAVNLPGADRWFPALAPVRRALEERFCAPANLQLFLSPEGTGLRPHSDIHDSFVFQIAGRKVWTVADLHPDDPLLPGNSGRTVPEHAVEVELAPGDVLYKPSHGVHATAASGGPSLSLTASVVTRTALDVLVDRLRARLAGDPAWLERLPLVEESPVDRAARKRVADATLPEIDQLR